MIVTKLENSIDSIMSALEEAADMQAELDNAKSELAMFSMLYDINQYISTNLEIKNLIPLVEDIVLGTVGANYCVVILEDYSYRYTTDFGIDLSYEDLHNTVKSTMLIKDLSLQPMLGLDKGSLYIHKMNFAEDTYGYIVVYWAINCIEKDKKVEFLSILSTQVDLTIKNAKLMEKLTNLASHDFLTGIYNRTQLNDIEGSTLPSIGECTILFDIDDFKLVNDTNGHTYGDTILKEFANILSSNAKRANGTSFRYGGEEFLLKCDCDELEGLKLANVIREQFTAKTGYTVSAGISVIGDSCKLRDYKTLINLADAAMYASKQRGKNKATISNSDIQLCAIAANDICEIFNKVYKQPDSSTFNLFRLDIASNCAFNISEFEDFKTKLQNTCSDFRVYVTESLSAFFISEESLDLHRVIQNVQYMLAQHYPTLVYTLFECNTLLCEVTKHSIHVADLVKRFGSPLGLSDDEILALTLACDWHDVGKLCITPAVYSKPGKLSLVELERIKYHALLGYSIAKQTQNLKHCADWILMHHEDYNGEGYYSFKGDQIPLPAQVLSLFDKLDALTEDRCYRKAYTLEEALEILKTESHRFNPQLFECFLKVLPDYFP